MKVFGHDGEIEEPVETPSVKVYGAVLKKVDGGRYDEPFTLLALSKSGLDAQLRQFAQEHYDESEQKERDEKEEVIDRDVWEWCFLNAFDGYDIKERFERVVK